MSILHNPRVQNAFMSLVDTLFTYLPQKTPKTRNFLDFSVISHRGQHDNSSVIENTMPAFDRATQCPIAGIEFDIQWTRDMEPVVCHDQNFLRLFGNSKKIEDLNWIELQSQYPHVPHFSEVLQKYKKFHLMIEIKNRALDWPLAQKKLSTLIKKHFLSSNFHLISLDPQLFYEFADFPKKHFLTIARTNVQEMSQLALDNSWGGLTGQYLLISKKVIQTHHEAGQIVGVGFPPSLNGLFREYNRGADFIFTNHALELYDKFSSSLHPR